MSRTYLGDFLDGAEKTLCVYRYIDCADDTIKYVGIVRKATLKDRIMAHFCSDEWAKEKIWRVEYFECETQSEVEAFEGHLISLYGTGKYYNKSKASWGLNKYLPDIESKWKLVYKSNALDIETAKEILRFRKLVREKRLDDAMEIFKEFIFVEDAEK